jgi:tetratricopeptide (TPR) repeat protein
LAVIHQPLRRRFAMLVLGALIVVHLGAFFLYTRRERQSQLLTQYLDARDLWKAGHLDAAAREYQDFLAARDAAAWPLVLVRNFPDAASGWFVLGRVETERGQTDAALGAFERAMALDPGRGRREYRDLLLDSGRGAALAEFARRELARDPASALAAKDLGAALLATRDPGAAVAAYERALTLLPAFLARRDPAAVGGLSAQEADLLNLLSVAARLAGDRHRADQVCDGLARRAPRGTHLDRLCRAYGRADGGDLAGAREDLAGYQPPAPEHEALAAALAARLAPGG